MGMAGSIHRGTALLVSADTLLPAPQLSRDGVTLESDLTGIGTPLHTVS